MPAETGRGHQELDYLRILGHTSTLENKDKRKINPLRPIFEISNVYMQINVIRNYSHKDCCLLKDKCMIRRLTGFWNIFFLLWDSFNNSIFSNCSTHFVCMGLVTIMLEIFKLCLCSSKMNNLLSLLYLHLENLLRAISSWHSKCWTKQAGLRCKALGEQLQYARTQTSIEVTTVLAPEQERKWAGKCHYDHGSHWGPNFANPSQIITSDAQSGSLSCTKPHNKSRLQTPKGDSASEERPRCHCNNYAQSAEGGASETTATRQRAERDGPRGLRARGRVYDQ